MILSRDPHTDPPVEILDFCGQVVGFIASWAFACEQSDEGGNLDMGQLEGLGMLTAMLATMLKEASQHGLKRCACYKEKAGP